MKTKDLLLLKIKRDILREEIISIRESSDLTIPANLSWDQLKEMLTQEDQIRGRINAINELILKEFKQTFPEL